MFGKAWSRMWKAFDSMMEELPKAIDEAVESGASRVNIVNGNVSIKGDFKSLKINGYTVNVPEKVMKGRRE